MFLTLHRYSVVSSEIHEIFGSPKTDSARLICLFAASGVLKGIPSVDHPHVYIILQEVIVSALHARGAEYSVGDGVTNLWTSAVGLALAYSGLCSKNTTLGMFFPRNGRQATHQLQIWNMMYPRLWMSLHKF